MTEREENWLPKDRSELQKYVEEQNEELFATVQILNALEFPVVRTNLDDTIRFANNVFLEATDLEFSDVGDVHQRNEIYRERMCEHSITEFFGGEDLEQLEELKAEAERNYNAKAKNTFRIGATADLTFVSAKGTETPFRTNVSYSGKYHAYQISLVDITDLKDAQQELSAAYADMEEQVREQTEQIQQQAQAILEMSTPVIRLWRGILLLPLIGTIDTQRAQQMSDQFLAEIASDEVEVAIIDVTGVPIVDTGVARHLIDTVNSAHILGAETIISGFSPETAQTIVQLGVDFGQLRTQGTLQAAVREALGMLGIRVKKNGE